MELPNEYYPWVAIECLESLYGGRVCHMDGCSHGPDPEVQNYLNKFRYLTEPLERDYVQWARSGVATPSLQLALNEWTRRQK